MFLQENFPWFMSEQPVKTCETNLDKWNDIFWSNGTYQEERLLSAFYSFLQFPM